MLLDREDQMLLIVVVVARAACQDRALFSLATTRLRWNPEGRLAPISSERWNT